jgi:hypothetical protein
LAAEVAHFVPVRGRADAMIRSDKDIRRDLIEFAKLVKSARPVGLVHTYNSVKLICGTNDFEGG